MTAGEPLTLPLSGATRLFVIVGDPIAQVKSPGGITRGFVRRGVDAVVVPVQVAPSDVGALFQALDTVKNLDGILATVPHKFAAFSHCASTTPRAAVLETCNIMRRRSDGAWHGDMGDGAGFLAALVRKGGRPAGARTLLVGAGGAGRAIGLAFLDAGVSDLAIHDADARRRDDLVALLSGVAPGRVRVGSDDPAGFDIVANASPAGMKPGDPLPVRIERLAPSMTVGCVVTEPAETPLVAAARRLGCTVSTGVDMFEASQEAIVDFLLHRDG
ncbi:shikimate dehydrogenase [uncultured Alsobacter sp.]|uniref:shikimate dehydrogenase family protein n=1 Tax=uncultured Alsobacter sp. TaxID=1748258 RepID=UPI0025E4ED24|nr:shikimate dehydrogenase [uncultured Alsobacter sp.]